MNLWNKNEMKVLELSNLIKGLKDFDPETAYEKTNLSLSEWIKEWDFSKSDTKIYTHGIHQYPAMFIPQVIRKLIIEFSKPEDTVLDIFNGSGTTMVECMVTGRKSIGIEQNPLAILISNVKTTPLDTEEFLEAYIHVLNTFETLTEFEIHNFANIDIWFTKGTKENLSRLLHSINSLNSKIFRNAFHVCFSDIVRFFSTCKHSGFKMHRDKNKIDKERTSKEILDKFHNSVGILAIGIYQLNSKLKKYYKPLIMHGDSCKYQKKIGNNSSDLIITSPPYGDSKTTVAYGQFSRLSSQWLGLIGETDRGIENVDSRLLGGNINGLSLDDPILKKSITLKTSFNNYLWDIDRCSDKKEKNKLIKRSKDVLSFYRDLDQTIKNGSTYLKKNKYFIFITGSRVVKNVKLNTDLIIAELGEIYRLVLDGILYRKTIPKKRMPNKVSPSNIPGETAPTMTKESIVLLRKI